MKILLIQIPHYYEGKSRPPSSFPLGLGYIAKILLNANYEVKVLDIWANQYTNEEVKQKIRELDYDIVGISAISTQYTYVKWLTSELKRYKKNKLIVVGNALATYSPEVVLKNTETDICCIGEGEITFKEIIENIHNLENVKGIYFKKDNNIIKNSPREYIQELDTIPFPAWDIFPIEIYLKNCRVYKTVTSAMNVITARGCPFRCKFCSKTFGGFRIRSAKNIVEEIKVLKEKYGIKGIFFNEELFVINKKRAIEICESIKTLNIKWNCQGRINLVDFELLKCMKNSGCIAIGYGVESGSQTILNNMNKNITVAQAEKVLKDTVDVGLIPIIQMMYGYPGETRETVRETVNFFRRLPYLSPYGILGAIDFSPITPLPGSELYTSLLNKGIIKDEEEYLLSLESGYMPDKSDKTKFINLTEFSDEEYFQILKNIKKEIFRNHLKKYIIQFMKDYINLYLNLFIASIRTEGYKQTIRKIIKKLSI